MDNASNCDATAVSELPEENTQIRAIYDPAPVYSEFEGDKRLFDTVVLSIRISLFFIIP